MAVPTLKTDTQVIDGVLYVAEQLGVSPARCVVFEDAEKGVLAAHAAGMACIAVPNSHTMNNDFSKATRVVASLEEVDLALIDSLGSPGVRH